MSPDLRWKAETARSTAVCGSISMTLKHSHELETSILPLGDGVALSVAKKKEEIAVTDKERKMADILNY